MRWCVETTSSEHPGIVKGKEYNGTTFLTDSIRYVDATPDKLESLLFRAWLEHTIRENNSNEHGYYRCNPAPLYIEGDLI